MHKLLHTFLLAGCGLLFASPLLAHPSLAGHEHPHESVADTALLGLDGLVLVALSLTIVASLASILKQRRK